MKIIRLIVNYGIVFLAPLLIIPWFFFIIITNKADPKDPYFSRGEKWLWE